MYLYIYMYIYIYILYISACVYVYVYKYKMTLPLRVNPSLYVHVYAHRVRFVYRPCVYVFICIQISHRYPHATSHRRCWPHCDPRAQVRADDPRSIERKCTKGRRHRSSRGETNVIEEKLNLNSNRHGVASVINQFIYIYIYNSTWDLSWPSLFYRTEMYEGPPISWTQRWRKHNKTRVNP